MLDECQTVSSLHISPRLPPYPYVLHTIGQLRYRVFVSFTCVHIARKQEKKKQIKYVSPPIREKKRKKNRNLNSCSFLKIIGIEHVEHFTVSAIRLFSFLDTIKHLCLRSCPSVSSALGQKEYSRF